MRPITLDAQKTAPYTCTCVLAVASAPTSISFHLETVGILNVSIYSCETRACASPRQLYPSVGAAKTQGEVCGGSQTTEVQCRKEGCCIWENGCKSMTAPGDACTSLVGEVFDEQDGYCQSWNNDVGGCEPDSGCCQWNPSDQTCSAPSGVRCWAQIGTDLRRDHSGGLYAQFLEVRMEASSPQSQARFAWETMPMRKSSPCRACPGHVCSPGEQGS